MANAANKVRQTFLDKGVSQTLQNIRIVNPDLKPNEISMALCYLRKARHLSRELVESESKGRKQVWLYTYHHQKLPKDQNANS
jgi:hypothetical protein